MQIPRSYIENYSDALNVVSDKARAALVDALSQIDYSADVAEVRNAVIAIMQPACGASSTLAARLAAEFYDGLRARFGIDDGFTAEVDSQRVPEATEGAVRAFAQDLVDDKPIEQFVGKCADRIDYETRKAANECMAYNAKNDPKKPRWARVPAGAETCQFCIMLASRGFVYHSEETASHAHAHCDCRVVVSWDKKNPSVQGYDPEKYYDMWKHPEKYANQASEPMSEHAEYYVTVADSLQKKAGKLEDRALKRMERDYEFTKEALSGSNASYSKIEAFYQGADEQFFKAKMTEARERGIRQAIKDNPAGDNEYFSNAELKASKEFAESTVELPKEITGRSTAKTPRIADMRSYFDKDGNPINVNARDGGYGAWKSSWGKAFADKEKKRRS